MVGHEPLAQLPVPNAPLATAQASPEDSDVQTNEKPRTVTSRDHDTHKGATEDDRPSTTNAPGLDDEGLPNDETAIAADALGAREDGSQG